MSSNLTAESKAKYAEYLQANDLDERIRLLEEFLSLVPKHKATERIVALNRTRLAKLKQERESRIQRQKALSAATEDPFSIKREPHTPQILLVSDFFDPLPGPGKTTLIKALTGAKEGKIGVFTPTPIVGIFEYDRVKFQLIEEPALHNTQYLPRLLTAIRGTDMLAFVVDLSQDPIKQIENMLEILTANHIYVNRKRPQVKIEKTGSGGVQLFFLTKDAKKSEPLSDFIKEMVSAIGIKHATVKIYEEINVNEIEMAFNKSSVFLPAIIISTKADLPGTKENFQTLTKYFGLEPKNSRKVNNIKEKKGNIKEIENNSNGKMEIISKKERKYLFKRFEIFPCAITQNNDGLFKIRGLDNLGERLLKNLHLIRIYTRSKKGVADRPLILHEGSTVGDVAKKIHKDLYKTFRYAFIYRDKATQKRIRAGLDFPIQEFDVIEIISRI